jgi:hypothetical protein
VEITSAVSAPITWPAWIAVTSASDGVVSAVAFTIMVLIARITIHTPCKTPVPTERQAIRKSRRAARRRDELIRIGDSQILVSPTDEKHQIAAYQELCT